MAEPISPEQLPPVPPSLVEVGGQRVGVQVSTPGQSYELSNIYGPNAQSGAGDQPSELYFKTSSGNIYRVDLNGAMENVRDVRKTQRRAGFLLGQDVLASKKITIGEGFVIPVGSTNEYSTSPVVEPVAVSQRMFSPDAAKSRSGGRSTTLVQDYWSQIPPDISMV